VNSSGQLQGFNSLGSPVTLSIKAPESWQKIEFLRGRRVWEKTNSIEGITKRVKGEQSIQEVLFSSENFDRLYSQAIGVNGNKLLNSSNKHYTVSLIVKDEGSSIPIYVR